VSAINTRGLAGVAADGDWASLATGILLGRLQPDDAERSASSNVPDSG